MRGDGVNRHFNARDDIKTQKFYTDDEPENRREQGNGESKNLII